MSKPLAWSFSALNSYETCPWRYYLTKVTKEVKEPMTEVLREGQKAHKALELHVNGTKWLPDEYQAWVPLAEKFKAAPGTKLTEYRVALNRDLRPVDYFAKDVWVRCVYDLAVTREKSVSVWDYKTGKRKEGFDQLKLFAASAFSVFPYAEKVHTGYLWLNEPKESMVQTETWEPGDAPNIWKEFSIRVERMEESAANGHWPKQPSGLCRKWCPVGKAKCEHCGAD